MPMSEIAGIAAGLVAFFIGHVWYMVTIIRGKTRPHLFTWITSALLAGIMLVSYWASGAEQTIYVPMADFLGLFLIALLAWRYGNGRHFSWSDYFCLGAALVAMVVYAASRDPLWVFRALLATEVLALVPTMVKTWRSPEEEDFIAWTGTCLGNGLNYFALNFAIEAEVTYVYTIFFADLVVWLLIVRGKLGSNWRSSSLS